MNKKMGFLAMLFLLSSNVFSLTHSQEKNRVPLIFDANILSKIRTPQYMWLTSGKVLLLDSRREPESQTLELFNPQIGKREPALDARKVLAALKEILPEGALTSLRWPDALPPNGRGAVYILAGDLFFINLENGEVKRLTKTPSEETAVTFSPDGLWVCFIRNNDLYAIEIESGKEKRLTQGATETLLNGTLSWVYWEEIYERTSVPYVWSPDSKAVAYLQTDDSPVPLSTFVNFSPATQGIVRQHYPKAGQSNPKVRLGIVDLSRARTTWVDCGSYEYLARFNWLPTSQEIAVQTLDRKQSTLRLFFTSRLTGESREILVERQPAWINLHNSLYFLKDGKKFIWLSERDGYQHLYLCRLDGQLTAQLTKGEFMVCPAEGDIVMENGGLVGVDEKKGWIYFTSNLDALKDKYLYRIKADGSELKKLSAGEGVHAIRFSPDMSYYLDTYSSSSLPPEFSLHKADGEKISTITPSAKEVLAKWNLTYPEFAKFKTEDGLELPAMMVKPRNFDPKKKYPALVYVYGGPGSQQVTNSWSDRILWHNLLAQEGFFVFVFEVRAGMGKSKALETSVFKQAYGMQNVKDILSGVSWLKQNPSIDPKRLGIWGGSGGGCTTLFTMTHSDVFKAGISLYPVSDWHFYDTIYTERYQSTPQDNPQGYKETSSVLAASNLKGRLLIVHGTYDDNVHPQNTEAFINVLIEKNIPFELMIYPWRKHGIGDYPARVHLYTLMLDFWKRNI